MGWPSPHRETLNSPGLRPNGVLRILHIPPGPTYPHFPVIPRDSVGKQAGSGEGGASPPKQVWGDRVGAISGFLKSIKMRSAYIPKSLSLNGYGTLFRYFSLVQDDLSSGLWRWHRFEGNVNSLILLISGRRSRDN